MESTLDPKDWGWKLEDGSMDEEPAPDELLNIR